MQEMTCRPRETRDANEADRQARRGRCGHGVACRCIVNVGVDAFAAETRRLKAEHDERGYASPPLGAWKRKERL